MSRAASIQEIWIVDASVYTLLELDIKAFGIASWYYASTDVEQTLANGSVDSALGGVNHASEVISFNGVSYDVCDASS